MAVSQGRGEVVAQEGVKQPVRGYGHGQGQDPSGDPLGEADEIGHKSNLMIGEETAGSSESCHDFVKDHRNPALTKDAAELPKEGG